MYDISVTVIYITSFLGTTESLGLNIPLYYLPFRRFCIDLRFLSYWVNQCDISAAVIDPSWLWSSSINNWSASDNRAKSAACQPFSNSAFELCPLSENHISK